MALTNSTILTETIGGVVDQRIGLNNSTFARLHGLGTAWNVLRIGLRVQMENFGASLPGGSLFVGLCSGTTNIFGTQNPTSCFGYVHHSGSWSFAAAGGGNMSAFGNGNSSANSSVKVVNGVLTYSAFINDGQTTYWPCDPTTATRRMLFVDIIKGSPNYSLNFFFCNSQTASPDVLVTDYQTKVLLTTPSATNHSFTPAVGALAFDQSAGTLDAVNLSWSLDSVKMHICDLAVIVIS